MNRKDRKESNDLLNTLKGMREYEEKDPEYLKTWRHARRERLLAARVPTRTCPVCGKVKVKSRQWILLKHVQINRMKLLGDEVVVKARQAGVLCRSCAMKPPFRKLLWRE